MPAGGRRRAPCRHPGPRCQRHPGPGRPWRRVLQGAGPAKSVMGCACSQMCSSLRPARRLRQGALRRARLWRGRHRQPGPPVLRMQAAHGDGEGACTAPEDGTCAAAMLRRCPPSRTPSWPLCLDQPLLQFAGSIRIASMAARRARAASSAHCNSTTVRVVHPCRAFVKSLNTFGSHSVVLCSRIAARSFMAGWP